MSWFTVIFSGFKKVSIKIFMKAEALFLSIWSILFLALGYFFSYTALSVSRDVRKFIGIILIFFIAFFLLEKLMTLIFEFIGNIDNENNAIEE
jgi:membrane protein DedA with SNARE-associated domain